MAQDNYTNIDNLPGDGSMLHNVVLSLVKRSNGTEASFGYDVAVCNKRITYTIYIDESSTAAFSLADNQEFLPGSHPMRIEMDNSNNFDLIAGTEALTLATDDSPTVGALT